MEEQMWETIALGLVDLEGGCHRTCHSWVDLHHEDFMGVDVHHKIYTVHTFEDVLIVDVVAKSLGYRVYLTPNFLLNLFILKVIVPMLISTKTCTLRC